MREFRGKTTKKEDENHEFNNVFVYGDLLTNKGVYYIHPQNNVFRVHNELANILIAHEVIPETVGQYTGLTDKNGKKIFEGDIVKVSYIEKRDYQGIKYDNEFEMIETVVYNEKSACFMLEIDNKGITMFRPLHDFGNEVSIKSIEVIGNIYDNRELLEVKDEQC